MCYLMFVYFASLLAGYCVACVLGWEASGLLLFMLIMVFWSGFDVVV